MWVVWRSLLPSADQRQPRSPLDLLNRHLVVGPGSRRWRRIGIDESDSLSTERIKDYFIKRDRHSARWLPNDRTHGAEHRAGDHY